MRGASVSLPHEVDAGTVLSPSGIEIPGPGSMTCCALPQTVDFTGVYGATYTFQRLKLMVVHVLQALFAYLTRHCNAMAFVVLLLGTLAYPAAQPIS